MAVDFSVRCHLFLLVPCRKGAMRGGSDNYMSVRLLRGAVDFGLASLRAVCCSTVLLPFVWCVAASLMSQSNLLVLSGVEGLRASMSQSNDKSFIPFLFLPVALQRCSLFFPAISTETRTILYGWFKK